MLGRRGEQVPPSWEALEFIRTALGKLQARAGDEIRHDSRYENFFRLALRHDASGRVHGDAADVPAPEFDFAGMETGAQGQADLLGGRPERQRASDRAPRPIEGRENAV